MTREEYKQIQKMLNSIPYAKTYEFGPGLDLAKRTLGNWYKSHVDKSVQHGRWVKRKEDAMIHWDCSECGIGFLDDNGLEKLKYCPNCGARMDLEVDDD